MAKKKLKYAKPVITSIGLEPEQAILQTCIEGATLVKWLNLFANQVWCCLASGFNNCNLKGSGLGKPYEPQTEYYESS